MPPYYRENSEKNKKKGSRSDPFESLAQSIPESIVGNKPTDEAENGQHDANNKGNDAE